MADETPSAAGAATSGEVTTASASGEGACFELEFSLTVEDVAALGAHLATVSEYHLAQMRRTRWLVLYAILALAVLLALLERDLVSTVLFAVPLSIATAILWAAWPARYRSLARAQSAQMAQADAETGVTLGPRRYLINARGAGFSAACSSGYVLWPGVFRITSDENALYLHVAQNTAHVLPRRALSRSEFTDLERSIDYWRAQPGTRAPS